MCRSGDVCVQRAVLAYRSFQVNDVRKRRGRVVRTPPGQKVIHELYSRASRKCRSRSPTEDPILSDQRAKAIPGTTLPTTEKTRTVMVYGHNINNTQNNSNNNSKSNDNNNNKKDISSAHKDRVRAAAASGV